AWKEKFLMSEFLCSLLPSTRRAGSDGASRAYTEEDWSLLCQLCVAQERMARCASMLEGCIRKARSLARRAASSGASRIFICSSRALRSKVARRAGAKSI
ncbi:hypothetical protein A2U01_0056094, partial [Trifolium medium]|nr:hypothetical protein [Trifolium medium]